MVEAVIAGGDLKQVAAAEGVHPRTIARVLQHPQTQFELSALVQEHGEELRSMFRRSLVAISDGFEATAEVQTGPETWQSLADHRTRLGAVEQMRRLLQIADVRVAEGTKKPGWTWVEFRQMWMEGRRGEKS